MIHWVEKELVPVALAHNEDTIIYHQFFFLIQYRPLDWSRDQSEPLLADYGVMWQPPLTSVVGNELRVLMVLILLIRARS